MNMNKEILEQYFETEDMDHVDKFIKIFNREMLMSNKIKDMDAFLLSTYMACNKFKKVKVPREEILNIYMLSNKNVKSFNRIVYELTKRLKRGLIQSDDKNIGLTFEGINYIKEMIKNGYEKNKK